MLTIKLLTGPQVGKSFPLKPGRNVVGRAPHCDVVINSQNISKEHATIEVYNDKVIITDLNSRNGTFINGIQIKSQKLLPGEKLGFFDVLVELREKKNLKTPQKAPVKIRQLQSLQMPTPMQHGALAYNQQPADDLQPQAHVSALPQASLKAHIASYIDSVILPGVYKLAEWMEFRQVLGVFVITFIIFVTALSTIPLMRILKSSIEKEAQNRAQTIVRSLVRDNRAAIMQGQTSLVTTENAQREPGVIQAYVISNYNGDIIAPPQQAGRHLTDVPFVHEARKSNDELVSQVDDNTIVAVAPIRFYKSETGGDSVAAHAVVVYNMGSLAVDNGRTLSLFVQILFIAIVIGGLLYFFLFKMIIKPIVDLNNQVDGALKSGHGSISIPYKFPELQALATNINSAISRGGGNFGSEQLQGFEHDRSNEMQNIVDLVGFPALTINTDKIITAANSHFMSQIGAQGQWLNTPIQNIMDQALKLNLQAIHERVLQNTSQIATDQLEIYNQNFDISAQAIMGTKNVAYVLVVFVPKNGDDS